MADRVDYSILPLEVIVLMMRPESSVCPKELMHTSTGRFAAPSSVFADLKIYLFWDRIVKGRFARKSAERQIFDRAAEPEGQSFGCQRIARTADQAGKRVCQLNVQSPHLPFVP